MGELTAEQLETRRKIRQGSIIGGTIIGLIVGGIAYWLLGSQAGTTRTLGAIAAGIVVAVVMYWKNYNAAAKDARCTKCNIAFAVSRTDRTEIPTSSENREERKEQDDGSIEITTWTEEEFDVVETYTCSACGDETTKEFTTTRRKDEKTEVKRPEGKKGTKSAATKAGPAKK